MAVHASNQLAALGEPTPATEAIWKRAASDLLITVESGKVDPVVWEHAVRVVGLSLLTATLPELADQRIDRTALVAAALYHESGWAVQIRRQETPRSELLVRPTNDAQRELGASFLEQQAAHLLPEASLRIAVRAIRESGRKATQQAEAQILAEADNLDQIGPQAIWLMMRRQAADARGIDAMLDAWHRQQEYRYWEARLRECFRYEATRQLARRRLEAVERLMNDLRRAHRLEDVAEFLAGPDGTDC
jgi:hypothetical protein